MQTPTRGRFSGFFLLLLAVVGSPASRVEAVSLPGPLESNMIANRMVALRDGQVYAVKQGALLRLERREGDLWQRVAEDVQALSVDPRDNKILYAVTTRNAVVKSMDGGQKWLSIANGLPGAAIHFLLVNPTSSQEVFVGTDKGLYKTADGGFSWEPTPLTQPVSQLYVDPASPAHAYALTGGGAVLVSADSGTTWRKADAGLPTEIVQGPGKAKTQVPVKVSRLFFVSHATPYLLAVTAGKGLFRSADHGASWQPAGSGLDPAARFTTAYVGEQEVVIAGSEIARSSDGLHWTPLPARTFRFRPGFYQAITRHPQGDGYLLLFRYADDPDATVRIGYLGEGGALVGLSYGLLPRSDVLAVWPGRIHDRQAWFATVKNWTPTRDANRYEIEEATYLSVDDGQSWEYLFASECGTRVAARPGEANDVWMFGLDRACMSRGQEGGLHWTKALGARFVAMNDSVSRIAFDPADKGLLYYAAGVNDHKVYRYRYGTADKEGQAVDLNVVAADVVVCEDEPKKIYAGVGQVSTDGGWTWTDKSAALAKFIDRNHAKGYRRNDFTLLSCRGNEVRLALHRYDSYMHSGGFWILRSRDLGDNWEVASSFAEQQMTGLFLQPDDSHDLFVAVQVFTKERSSTRGQAIKVLESRDWGDTWREVYSHPLTADDRNHETEAVRTVSQAKTAGGRAILIGGRIGLWRSDDDGGSWSRLGGVR